MHYNSDAYRIGGQVGQVVTTGLMLFGVTPGYLITAQILGGIVGGVYAYADGDVLGAALSVANVALVALLPLGSVCQQASSIIAWSQRILHGIAAGKDIVAAFQDFSHGDNFGGFVNLFSAGANLFMGARACFAAGTPLRTPAGYKMIVEFKTGDQILSRAEDNPEGPIEVKTVEEVFERYAFILHLHVPGQVIRTTGEHPFYVQEKGWLPAHDLKIGDLLKTEEGGWVVVEDLLDTGEYETVYNFRIAEYHTYFVGGEDWGFSVWAHNANCQPIQGRPQHGDNWHNPTGTNLATHLEGVHGQGNVRWNQGLVDPHGVSVPGKRPDIQYISGGQVHIIELQSPGQSRNYMTNMEDTYRSLLGSNFGSYTPIYHP